MRIRGKLGQLSRTERVALALKQKAQDEMNAANAELAELRQVVSQHNRMSEDFARSEIFRAALDAMPEPYLICCHEAIIRYSNARMEAMFGYGEGEMVGMPVHQLIPKSLREAVADKVAAFIKDPHPMRIGIGRVVYGQRRNGTQFRIILMVDSRPTSHGSIFSVIVRDFAAEIDTRREHVNGWSLV